MNAQPSAKPSASSRARQSAPDFPGRTLPHSIEAEGNLLACCLHDGRASVTRCIAARFGPETFYDSAHGRIFDALIALHARQDAIDVATLALELQQRGELEAAGGIPRLTEISQYVPTTAQLNVFIRVVREKWILRELIAQGSRLLEDCYGSSDSLGEILSPRVAWFQNALARIMHGERAGLSLAERVGEVKGELAARAAGTEDRSRWVRTGLPRFDERLRPFGSDAEDHLVVIGGGSSSGKSALLRQIAGQALLDGQTVLAYTRETSVKGWVRQLASSWARCDLRTLDQAPRDHAERLQAECDRISSHVDRSLFVYQHEPGCSLENIEDVVAHARAFAWQRGAPHLFILDYLQLFGTRRRTNNREQEVAHVSHAIQALQRELGCVMLVAAQLNEAGLREMRAAKKDDKGRLLHRTPTAGDFRESQAIFHDADRVVAIYRPPENIRGEENYGPDVAQPEQWLVQIKRRYGGEGSVMCWFEKRYLLFRQFGTAEHSQSTAENTPENLAPDAPQSPEAALAALKASKLASDDAF